MREKLITYEVGTHHTHDLIMYRDTDPTVYGWLEVQLLPENYRRDLPRRRFVMPCRPICGLDLKRVRFTCMFVCKAKRVHAGKMLAMNELSDIYTLMIMKRRRHEWLKTFMLKKLLPVCEWAASY